MAKNDDFAPANNDAYTGMLSISLLALIGACVLLYLDFSQYPDTKPPQIVKTPIGAKLDNPIQKLPEINPQKDGKDKGTRTRAT